MVINQAKRRAIASYREQCLQFLGVQNCFFRSDFGQDILGALSEKVLCDLLNVFIKKHYLFPAVHNLWAKNLDYTDQVVL